MLQWITRSINVHTSGLRILGCDMSLRSTGLAMLHNGTFQTSRLQPDMMGVPRLSWFNKRLDELIELRPDLAVVEGYNMNAQRAAAMGELGGIVRCRFYDAGVTVLLVPPKTLKKFVTGNGNAEKQVLSKHLFMRWGVDIDQNDECDATGLSLFGLYKSTPIETHAPALPKGNVETTDKSEMIRPAVRARTRAA